MKRSPATSPKAQALLEQRQEQLQLQRVADVRAVMDSPAGRRFVWGLIEGAGTFGSSMTGNSETFFREGKRAVGIDLMVRAQQSAPEHYLLMLSEAMAARTEATLQHQVAEKVAATDEDA